MQTVNAREANGTPQQDMSIVDFWEQQYLPYCEEIVQLTGKARKKPSTVRGYEQIWNQHLNAHFGKMTLQRYEPFMGTQFLQSLTGTQGKNTLKHIKALGSSLFKRAVIEQRIKVNPWHDVSMPDDAIESKSTKHYTLEEAQNIISALVDHVDAQLSQAIEQEVEKCPEAQRLMTHPGVGPLTALAFVLIIGGADRFQCGKQIASYRDWCR
jgi:hypothetical protein